MASWTLDEIEAATRVYNEGLSASACANALSDQFKRTISRNSVIGIWFRKGLGGRAKPATAGRPKSERRPQVRKITRVRPANSHGALHLVETLETDQYEVRVANAAPLHINHSELTSDNCHYPFGRGPYTFCGCPAIPGMPYCQPHQTLCGGDQISEHERRSRAMKRAWEHKKAMRAEAVSA